MHVAGLVKVAHCLVVRTVDLAIFDTVVGVKRTEESAPEVLLARLGKGGYVMRYAKRAWISTATSAGRVNVGTIVS